LFRDALETLLNGFAESQSARYWRFYHAQLLEEAGEFAAAAEEYGRVDSLHEHHLEAGFRRVRALAREAARRPAEATQPTAEATHRINEMLSAQRDLLVRASAARRGGDSQHDRDVDERVAESRILLAEVYLLPGIRQADRALEAVADFERTAPRQSPLLGRAWRAKLQALEWLGRFDEAARVVPDYVAADPVNAGPTLQALYQSLRSDIESMAATGGAADPAGLQMLIAIAGEIVRWTRHESSKATPEQQREAAVQQAEAHLIAGRFAEARQLFDPLIPKSDARPESLDSLALRSLLGHAESLLREGDAARALPEFNLIATNLPPDHPFRWQALVGDLASRTALGHPPEGILRVIAQQRRLFPQMGGPAIAAQLDHIERENIRRRDQVRSPQAP
jgi:tetratricopeptide (TPR) repeat protein